MRELSFIILMFLMNCSCISSHKSDGWYHLAPFPDDTPIGEPLLEIKDFKNISLINDTFVINGDTIHETLICGSVNDNKRKIFANCTERLIGDRLGFVFNDSVITAPKINARIESGHFQINSPDSALLRTIYISIQEIVKK